jgi:outer membrane autotransporter protein
MNSSHEDIKTRRRNLIYLMNIKYILSAVLGCCTAIGSLPAQTLTVDGTSLSVSGGTYQSSGTAPAGSAFYVLNGGTLNAQGVRVSSTWSTPANISAGFYGGGVPWVSVSAGLLVSGTGSEGRLGGGVVTTGTASVGISADTGGVARVLAGSTIVTGTVNGYDAIYAHGVMGVDKSSLVQVAGNVDITTYGSESRGILVCDEAVGVIGDASGTVRVTTSGTRAAGLQIWYGSGRIDGAVAVDTYGVQGWGVLANTSSDLTMGAGSSLSINTSGSAATGLFVQGESSFTGANVSVVTSGSNAHGVSSSVSSVVSGSQFAIRATGAGASALQVFDGGVIELTDFTAVSEQSHGLIVQRNDNKPVNATNRVVLTGGSLSAPNGDLVAVYSSSTLDNSVTRAEITLDSVAAASDGNVLHVRNNGVGKPVDAQVDFTAKNYSTLRGAIITDSGVVANVTLDDHAEWLATGDSNMTSLLNQNASIRFDQSTGFHTITTDTYTSNGGALVLNTVLGNDSSATVKLIVANEVNGVTTLFINNQGGIGARTVNGIRVVELDAGTMIGNEFVLGNHAGAGMYDYALDVRNDGVYLVNSSDSLSSAGNAVLNSAGAVSGFWFTQMDNLQKRMGELRYNAPSKGNLIENIWIRSYGQQANIHTGIGGVKGFSETQYGVDLGTDKAWSLDKDNTLYTGVFAGYGGADREFHTGYNGSSDSGYGGLYGTWLHQDGWYADAVAKGQYFRNDFDGEDHGSYDSVGVGLSLELGRQFQFADGWFAEPSVQVSYLHLINDNYGTTQGMSVDLDDADIVQFYGGARLGRNIKLNQDGWLQPYVKIGGIEQISSGGKVRASGSEWRPTTDGARAVIGAGIVYQFTAADQLHLDYEASFGDKYDKPWGLNFGYRHQF